MAKQQGDGQRQHNRLVLSLKRAIEAEFTEAAWRELGYATDTIQWIQRHGRLLRSLSFGDHDYGDCVLQAVEHILSYHPDNLGILLRWDGVAAWLRENDPVMYDEYYGGNTPAVESLADTRRAAIGFDVEPYIRRIRDSLNHDPALAVGSTKELLEAVFKNILGLHGAKTDCDEMPKLLKQCQVRLGIDPANVNLSIPGAESLRRLHSGMSQIVMAVVELRNLYGTGHGKCNAPELDIVTSNLVVTAGTALATYLMTRFRGLEDGSSS